MSKSEAQARAEYKWRREKCHRIAIDCTLADYDTIAEAARVAGQPVRTFCRRAIMAAAGHPLPEAPPVEEPTREPLEEIP